jgi:hypothetical protein
MRAPEVMRLIASGAIKPEAEVAVELGFPPVKITLKLKAGDLQKLMLDTGTVSDVLRRCFGQRRILRESYSEEVRDYCVKSAEEIIAELRRVKATLPGVGANAALSELLARWEDISVDTRQKLQGNNQLSDILREYRVKSLPIVDALIAMLPQYAPARLDAEQKIRETRQSLPGPDLARISDAWRLTDTM